MKKLKSNHDRLSELPDSLIHEILSFLDMRDVVRTTLLSKRWKNLWITIPCLQFKDRGSFKNRYFVSRALKHWRGTYLRKFSICLFGDSDASLSSDIDWQVLFAKERKVEELCIELYCEGPRYCPPQCLYECSSIRKLSLCGCNLQICGNVQWDRLNSLELFGCLFTEDVINQVVSSSPQLETLNLYCLNLYCRNGIPNLSIQSSTLKKLLIGSSSRELSVITIWAPNLEALKFEGGPFSKYLLTDVSSLSEVNLDFWNYKLSAVVGEALCQILPAIQHVVTVELSASCVEMLGVMKGNYSLSPFLNAKLLRIGGGLTELSELVGLLEIFPKLKTLIIDWHYAGEFFEFNAENYIVSEANILKSNLLQLRTAEITWLCHGAAMFQFIEFLLKHATVIEKMVIRRRVRVVDLEAQKVVSLQRSFPSVELILC